LPEL
jgi:hypothetical protein